MIQCSWHLFMLIGLSIASPVIHTRLGVIKGSLKTSYYGKQFYAFEGIPYAKPPIGNLRFKPPVPIESWNGVWEATKLYECIQSSVIPLPNRTGLTGEEDCLYVNVYTPEFQRTESKRFDVIVSIPGGGFYAGSGHSYTKPTYLLDRNMIFVSFNYRLGPLGFLSTGNNLIPGNLGLKDQVLALKWVEENIEYFHGNKNSITLSGFSSGAASAEFHLFSPLSKDINFCKLWDSMRTIKNIDKESDFI